MSSRERSLVLLPLKLCWWGGGLPTDSRIRGKAGPAVQLREAVSLLGVERGGQECPPWVGHFKISCK